MKKIKGKKRIIMSYSRVNEMRPLITVIVPVYNVERYLKKCVDSILEQTYSNIEILLVDDGSTDSSGIICDKYSTLDNRIQVFHKKNGGLSDARNVGIQHMNGEYVVFIDSDDTIKNNYIEYLYNLLEKNNADIAMCNFEYIREDGTLINNPQNTGEVLNYSQKDALSELLNGKRINTSASMKLYKSILFSDVRYPVGKLYEDIGTTYKLFLKTDHFVYGDNALYVYLCRKGSITKNVFSEKKLDGIYFTEEMCKYIQNVHPSLKNLCDCRVYKQYITMYLDMKNYKYSNKEIEIKLFSKIKNTELTSCDGRIKLYYTVSHIGKKPFDLLCNLENRIQKVRKKV